MKSPRLILFGGTSDSRRLHSQLTGRGIDPVISVTRPSAAGLYPGHRPATVNVSRLTPRRLNGLIDRYDPEGLLDATHPFADTITRRARAVAEERDRPFARWHRGSFVEEMTADLAGAHQGVTVVPSLEVVAQAMESLGDPYLVTTGTESLDAFSPPPNRRNAFVRTLPRTRAFRRAETAGFVANNIIALRPPVPAELEGSLLKEHDIRHLITKDSGEAGGLREKWSACRANEVRMWVLRRPRVEVPLRLESPDDLDDWLDSLA